jgi:LysM repeat protein
MIGIRPAELGAAQVITRRHCDPRATQTISPWICSLPLGRRRADMRFKKILMVRSSRIATGWRMKDKQHQAEGGVMDYRTQSGDTMSGIAAKFNISLSALEAANPQIADPNKIFPNEIIHVPVSPGSPHGPTSVPPHVVTYVVQSGDTKGAIAHAHNVSLAALEAANPQVTNPDLIHSGEVLNIPRGTQSTHHSPAHPVVADGAIPIDAVSYGLHKGGGDIESWTSRACQIMHVPSDHWVVGYKVLCRRESSGRANAINDWDSNAHGPIQSDGYPLHCSRGVAQCIPDTFASNHVAGTSTDIYDPVANIAASMHYVMNRYGVSSDGSNLTREVQQADPNRNPAGY